MSNEGNFSRPGTPLDIACKLIGTAEFHNRPAGVDCTDVKIDCQSLCCHAIPWLPYKPPPPPPPRGAGGKKFRTNLLPNAALTLALKSLKSRQRTEIINAIAMRHTGLGGDCKGIYRAYLVQQQLEMPQAVQALQAVLQAAGHLNRLLEPCFSALQADRDDQQQAPDTRLWQICESSAAGAICIQSAHTWVQVSHSCTDLTEGSFLEGVKRGPEGPQATFHGLLVTCAHSVNIIFLVLKPARNSRLCGLLQPSGGRVLSKVFLPRYRLCWLLGLLLNAR